MTWYEAALYLYPPAFRREFGGEMLRDFDEASREMPRAARFGDRWALRIYLTSDLAKSILIQWVRTRLPLIALVAMTLPLLITSALVGFFNRLSFFPPPIGPDREILELVLLVVVVLFVIVTTILFVSWHIYRFTRGGAARRRPL